MAAKAPKTYIVNLVTDPAETNDYKASDFIKKIEEYYGHGNLIDYAVVNTAPIEGVLSNLYTLENKFPVEADLQKCKKLVNKDVISGNFLRGKTVLRHDCQHLAEIILANCAPFKSACFQVS
jgi:2-phospho-L-lactate transferase/gluconeogenesis factor (CofD/UPF0052 family)